MSSSRDLVGSWVEVMIVGGSGEYLLRPKFTRCGAVACLRISLTHEDRQRQPPTPNVLATRFEQSKYIGLHLVDKIDKFLLLYVSSSNIRGWLVYPGVIK